MSKGEVDLALLLHEEFPHYKIITQHPIKIDRHTLYLDFFLPQLKLAVEYDGIQHFEQNDHFHRSTSDFLKGKVLDNLKTYWCEHNNVTLIRISYKEKVNKETWREKLNGKS